MIQRTYGSVSSRHSQQAVFLELAPSIADREGIKIASFATTRIRFGPAVSNFTEYETQNRAQLPKNAFQYRVLLVDDEENLRILGKHVLESQGYEVHCAGDGFEGLAALKRSLPDMIISDLSMPNMNGFEFLSVVRIRFPAIPVVVISGEFSGDSVPESVLADAFFRKGGYQPAELFEKISELLVELPTRPRKSRHLAAVWVKNDMGLTAVTCPQCLRTFPMEHVSKGINETHCDFCSNLVNFEITARPMLMN